MDFYLRGFLLVICFCAHETWGVVYTEPLVTGWINGRVLLSCKSSLVPYAVYWLRGVQSDPGESEQIAQNLDGDITTFGDRYIMYENNSVAIEDLMVTDEDMYVCQVVTDKGEDSRNTTQLKINARASRPHIEQCDNQPSEPTSPDMPTICKTATSPKYSIFNLECRVTGFRPNISLDWSSDGRLIKPLGEPAQTRNSDDTYDLVVTISVQAKADADQNFTCRATGEAVQSGTASAIVTVLALPQDAAPTAQASSGGLSPGGKFGVALISIILIAAVVFGLLILVALMLRNRNRLPAKGEWALNKIRCLRREHAPDPEEVKLEKLENERSDLRERIAYYELGKAAGISVTCNAEKANINMFGQMSAGKSALLNSLNFAFTGVWSEVSQEGGFETGGGMTIKRVHHPLTDSINLIDNRGMKSFDRSNMQEILETVRGERGIDPTQEVERDENSEIHCAIFVYHETDHGKEEALRFMEDFNNGMSRYYGRQPLIVLTHKDKIDTDKLKGELQIYGISKNNIFGFENYTKDSNTEVLEKDIEFLKFLLKALETCDRNIVNLEREKKETPKPKKVVVEKEKEKGIRTSLKKKKKDKREPYELVYAPTVEEYETPADTNRDQAKSCSLM